MKTKISLLVIFAFTFIIFSCKKETKNVDKEIIGDTLSESDNAYIDSVSVPNPTLHEMIGLDGNPLGRQSGVQTSLNDLIKAMLIDAQQLSGQKILSHPDEGLNKPQHMGLVYSYGQRDISQRLNPPYGNSLHKKYAVYGTDCSGLMIKLLRDAGINIPNCTVSAFETTLTNVLKNNPDSIKLENKGHLAVSEIESGDIIYWLSTGLNHIGIVSKLSNGGKIVFQSNGTGTPADSLDQAKNLGLTRGVHPINLITAINGRGYWGANYKILRLKPGDSTCTDIDGNVYRTIRIGTQVWMAENLKTTRYKDGSAIPTGLSDAAWQATTSGAYAIYDNNVANNTTYGKLYNWYAVNTGKLAPAGWHVPTHAEWTTLTTFLGGESVAGGAMKATTLWNSPNTGATNSSGFTGLPAGYRYYSGAFTNVGYDGHFWSSTEYSSNFAWNRNLNYSSSDAIRGNYNKGGGFSVRCVRD